MMIIRMFHVRATTLVSVVIIPHSVNTSTLQSPVYSVKSIEKRRSNYTRIVSDEDIFCPLAACVGGCETCSSAGQCDTCEDGFIKKEDGSACDGQLGFCVFLLWWINVRLLINRIISTIKIWNIYIYLHKWVCCSLPLLETSPQKQAPSRLWNVIF